VNKEILAREKFIWDDIIERGSRAVQMVKDLWRKKQSVPRFIFVWPSEKLATTDGSGTHITHYVTFPIPEEMNVHAAAVLCAKNLKPYAMLAVEREGTDVKILLESFHGTRCWRLPIRRHGDVEVLEKESVSSNVERLGILWRGDASTA
jgi:hypothetical protein